MVSSVYVGNLTDNDLVLLFGGLCPILRTELDVVRKQNKQKN